MFEKIKKLSQFLEEIFTKNGKYSQNFKDIENIKKFSNIFQIYDHFLNSREKNNFLFLNFFNIFKKHIHF